MQTTITLPRDLYSDRRDDEDRVFITGPTLEAAARLWVAQDRTRRNIGEVNLASPSSYVFTWQGEHCQVLTLVSPDEDMEGLYQADLLPFVVDVSPFAVGDVVKHWTLGARTVIRVEPRGTVIIDKPTGGEYESLSGSLTLVRTAAEQARLLSRVEAPPLWEAGDYVTVKGGTGNLVYRLTARRTQPPMGWDVVRVGAGGQGIVPDDRADEYVKVDAPTVTYTVTVRADHDADDVQDAIAGVLSGPVTVTGP